MIEKSLNSQDSTEEINNNFIRNYIFACDEIERSFKSNNLNLMMDEYRAFRSLAMGIEDEINKLKEKN